MNPPTSRHVLVRAVPVVPVVPVVPFFHGLVILGPNSRHFDPPTRPSGTRHQNTIVDQAVFLHIRRTGRTHHFIIFRRPGVESKAITILDPVDQASTRPSQNHKVVAVQTRPSPNRRRRPGRPIPSSRRRPGLKDFSTSYLPFNLHLGLPAM